MHKLTLGIIPGCRSRTRPCTLRCVPLPQDVADLLYILVSGNVTVMLKQSAEDVAEAKEAREAIAAGRAKPLAERERYFLEEVGTGSRRSSTDHGAQAPLGVRTDVCGSRSEARPTALTPGHVLW